MRLRPAGQDDIPFVAASWLESYSSSEWATLCTPHGASNVYRCDACGSHHLRWERRAGAKRWRAGETYWAGQRRLIALLVASSNVTVAEADDGLLDGWIVRAWGPPVLHYLYVRQPARGQGIARALIADLHEQPARFTAWPRGLDARRLPVRWAFDPYALMVAA